MIEKGEVIGTEGKLAFVKFVRTSACGNCTACGMSSDEKEVIVQVWNDKDVKKGDFVSVNVETKKAMASSAIAYIFPLLMLIVGAVLGFSLGNVGAVAMSPDILGALMGVAFTLIAYLIIKLLEPTFEKRLKSTYKLAD